MAETDKRESVSVSSLPRAEPKTARLAETEAIETAMEAGKDRRIRRKAQDEIMLDWLTAPSSTMPESTRCGQEMSGNVKLTRISGTHVSRAGHIEDPDRGRPIPS